MSDSGDKKRIHFIGIGGCSMSGLARLMLQKGHEVSGSDRTKSHKTDDLAALGISICIGHAPEQVEGADLVVYSAAVAADNPERQEAARRNILQMERADFIGRLMEGYEHVLCIAGTHGKTTTTSMIAQVFVEAGADPTVHIGGDLPALGGGTLLGGNEFFIAESCEFSGTFLKFNPTISFILNIDEDHLDYYKDLNDIERAFQQFADRTPEGGWVVGWGDDARVYRVLQNTRARTRSYGLSPHNELRAEHISYDEEGRARFLATLFGHPLVEVEMRVAGEHNLLNALAAIAATDICQLPMSSVAETLGRFTGAHRRFELTSTTDGVKVYQDYAHNPAEMKNAIHIAALQQHKRLWAVWQPHTYSRTKTLFDGFLETFGEADTVLITDICGAREADPGDINTGMLVDAMAAREIDVHWTPSFDDTEAYLRAHWQPGDLVITLGCGDIDLLNEQIALHGDTHE